MSSLQSIDQAVQRLRAGGVIAYPTEAVWGLGCDPFDEQAVSQVLALKCRAVEKGLIIVAASIEQFAFLLEGHAPELIDTLEQSWPGPNTWLVPHQNRVPNWIHGNHQSVAIRVSAHPEVVKLCAAFGSALVSTSANPQGLPAAVSASEVACYFDGQLDAIMQGSVGADNQPSTIRDLLTGNTIRGAN